MRKTVNLNTATAASLAARAGHPAGEANREQTGKAKRNRSRGSFFLNHIRGVSGPLPAAGGAAAVGILIVIGIIVFILDYTAVYVYKFVLLQLFLDLFLLPVCHLRSPFRFEINDLITGLTVLYAGGSGMEANFFGKYCLYA